MGRSVAFSTAWLTAALLAGAAGLALSGAQAPPARTVEAGGEAAAVLPARDDWMGIYLQGNKIGYSRFECAPETSASPPRYRMRSEARMELRLLDTPQTADLSTEATFDARDFKPLSIRFSMKTPAMTVRAVGEVQGDKMVFTLSTPNSRETRVYDRDEVDFFGDDPVLRASVEPLEVGKVIAGYTIVPLSIERVPYRIEVLRAEPIRVGDRVETGFVLASEVMGVRTTSWVLADGTPVRVEGPMGLAFVRETEAAARSEGAVSRVDLALALSIRPTGAPISHAARRAVYRVTGLPADWKDLDGGVQRVLRAEGETTVWIEVDLARRNGAATKADLAPTRTLDAEDPKVVEAARKAAGRATGGAAAERLTRWVHERVRKEISFTLPTASDVVVSMAGDCNEHTVLYAAMARSLGLPARIATGVVLAEGRFLYHAWPEVYMTDEHGAGWVPVDPTFGDFPASAARIRLAIGEALDQARIVAVAGNLGVAVEEAE